MFRALTTLFAPMSEFKTPSRLHSEVQHKFAASPRPKQIHPNLFNQGDWVGPTKGSPKRTCTPQSLNDSKEEFFEASLHLSDLMDENAVPETQFSYEEQAQEKGAPTKRYRVAEHPLMSAPLLDDDAELDLSELRKLQTEKRWRAAAPFASVFDPVQDSYERSLLNFLEDEVDRLDTEPPEQSLWSLLKELSIGLSEKEYYEKYPWAKHVVRSRGNEEELEAFNR